MRLFNQIKLLTPESVELEFTLAGVGSRAFALLIDYHILGIGLVLFWIVYGMVANQVVDYLDRIGNLSETVLLWMGAIVLLLSFAIYSGYFILFEVRCQGQTPGKRMAQIRVIRDDGRPVGLSQALLRSLLRPIDDFLFLGAFLIVLGAREKRVGDWVAGTVVIQENRPLTRSPLTISPEATILAEQLPQLTALTKLSPDNFAVIREYLQRRSLMEARARRELGLQLARQLRETINLETIPDGLTSEQFLEAVYVAYQTQFPAY